MKAVEAEVTKNLTEQQALITAQFNKQAATLQGVLARLDDSQKAWTGQARTSK